MMFLVLIAAMFSFLGCSTISYSPPEARSIKENIVRLPGARDPFWKDFVSQLSGEFGEFFVIKIWTKRQV